MEKTQTGYSRARHRSQPELTGATGAASQLHLHFMRASELVARRAAFAGKLLGVVAFGGDMAVEPAVECPSVTIDMPVLGGEPFVEVWESDTPVLPASSAGIAAARNENVLFGCLEADAGDDIEAATRDAYRRIFDFIDAAGYGHLLRVWNYFPRITEPEAGGMERYRRFSIGRHDAFVARGRTIGERDVPAACAVGSRAGPLTIYFLAARRAGLAIENPRQVSAYRYPARYGPRSPTFSRALLMQERGNAPLFISGTASIVGHETLHAGDAGAQAQETINNVLAVIDRSMPEPFNSSGQPGHLYLKVYLRNADFLPLVRDRLREAFGVNAQVKYLRADICRPDLLLEVEGVRFGPASSEP